MSDPLRQWRLRAPLAVLCLLALSVLSPETSRGESISVPSANSCPRSDVQGGSRLTAGLGSNRAETIVVDQEKGAILGGSLSGAGGGVGGALICIYSTVTTDEESELLGIVVTDQNGQYEFAVPPGPSRNLTSVYRTDQGQITAWALLQTRVAPTLRLQSSVVHNKHFAHFSGEIPGPDNDGVSVVLQVKSGKGWRVFRRYLTREGGKFSMRYRFTQTFSPVTYIVRA